MNSTTKHKFAKNAVSVTSALALLGAGLLTSAPAAMAKTGDVTNPLTPGTYRYSSEYGGRCMPVIWGSTSHLGQDLALSDGAPIKAIADGVVTTVKDPSGAGSGYMAIKHTIDGETVYSGYYHMWKPSKYAYVGQKVKKGQVVAYVGSSGPSTAPHLHFEIWKGAFYGKGYTVNPVDYMKKQGVDLKKNAYLVYSFNKPSSCTYYSTTKSTIYSNASYNKPIGTVYQNQALTSIPGTSSQSGNFIKVSANGKTGWMYRGVVSPYKVKQTEATGNKDLPSTDSEKITSTTANVKYKTTTNLNMRTGANTTYSIVKTLNKGTDVVTTGKKSGSWLQVKQGTSTGWVSSAYLSKVNTPAPAPSKPKPAPTKPAPAPSKSVSYSTTANLHLRAGAGTTHKSLTVLSKGAKVTGTGKTNGKWVEVKAGSRTGWVSSTYLKKTSTSGSNKPTVSAPKPTTSKSNQFKTTANLHLRAGAGTNHKSLTILNKGTTVTKTGKTSGKWAQVKAGNKTGWVSTTYLQANKTSNNNNKPTTTTKNTTKKTTANLNMRTSGSTSGKIITTLKRGTSVSVLKSSNGWSQVKVGSKTGWVSNSYIK